MFRSLCINPLKIQEIFLLSTMVHFTPVFKATTLQNVYKGMTIPVHPGAEKYFKEKGVTKNLGCLVLLLKVSARTDRLFTGSEP